MKSIVFLFCLILFLCLPALSAQGKKRGPEVRIDHILNTPNQKVQGMEARVACANNGYTYAIWLDSRKGLCTTDWKNRDIYFNRSLNGGQTWDTEFCLNSSTSFNVEEYGIVCSSSGQRVHVAWNAQRGYFAGVYVASSSNYGQTFTSEKRLTGLDEWAHSEVKLCCSSDGMTAYIVWGKGVDDTKDSRVYFSYTLDGGSTWSTKQRISTSETQQNDSYCCCSENGRYLNLVWADNRINCSPAIYVRTWDRDKNGSGNGGWIGSELQASGCGAEQPQIACSADGKTAHIVWASMLMRHRRYYESGGSWKLEDKINLITDFLEDEQIGLYCYGNDLCCMVFEGQQSGDPHTCVYAARWTSGTGWQSPQKIVTPTPDTHEAQNVSLCGYQNKLWFVSTYSEDTKKRTKSKPVGKKDSRQKKVTRREPPGTVILTSSSTDGGITWSSATKVSENIVWAQSPYIACSPDGNNVCAVWDEARSTPHEPYARRLHPLADDVNILSNNDCSGKTHSPVMLRNGDELYAAWYSYWGDIYFNYSADKGATWLSDEVKVNGNSVQSVPVLCMGNEGTLYIGWFDNSSIKVAFSTDKGMNWTEETVCSVEEDVQYRFPWQKPLHIGAVGNTAYLVWCEDRLGDQEIYFCRRVSGQGWSSPLCLSRKMESETDLGDEGEFGSGAPSLAFDNSGNVYVAWHDIWKTGDLEGKRDIYVRRSGDYGASWDSPARVDRGNAGEYDSCRPVLALANGHVYVSWTETRDGNTPGVYFNASSDRGKRGSWGIARRIDGDSGDFKKAMMPIISVDESCVYVAWLDFSAQNKELFFNVSSDYGNTFQSTATQLSGPETRDRIFPRMAASTGKVWVTWMEERSGKWDVFLRRSIDHGTNWGTTISVDSTPVGNSHAALPQVAVENREASVAWSDDRNGTWNIYFRNIDDLWGSGGIEGKVTDNSDVPLESVTVNVYDGSENLAGSVSTNASGDYRVDGLTTGSYKVKFETSSQNYITEWYNDKSSFANADAVFVTNGQTTGNIHAKLALGGSISGNVTNGLRAPMENVLVSVYEGSQNLIRSAYTNEFGDYTIQRLSTGSYQVKFETTSQNYITEWYNDKASFVSADPVSVTQGSTTSNIDAQLTDGGTISGNVTNKIATALKNVEVSIYDLAENLVKLVYTDSVGNYNAEGMPTGNYKVKFSFQNYTTEWYNDKDSFTSASGISVTQGSTTTGINAELGMIGAITVEVTKPNGGEVIQSGTTYQITWNHSQGVTSQEIRLSTDGGNTFPTVIASGLAGDASYFDWSIPAELMSSRARIRVIVTDITGKSDDSNGNFVVFQSVSKVSRTYKYDKLNRLIEIIYEDASKVNYGYDAAGNRTSITATKDRK